jgi:hypothetical protein
MVAPVVRRLVDSKKLELLRTDRISEAHCVKCSGK